MGWRGQLHAPESSTPGKETVPIVQEAGWAPGPVLKDGKSRPHRYSIPDRPARNQSLYRLSYPAHYICMFIYVCMYACMCVYNVMTSFRSQICG